MNLLLIHLMGFTMINQKQCVRVTGFLIFAAMIFYGVGEPMVSSLINSENYFVTIVENSSSYFTGLLMMMLNSIAVLLIGILIYPVLKEYNRKEYERICNSII